MLEFQARQTRTAARLGLAFPSESRWKETALHGLTYLRDVMRDQRDGGWFWLVDRNGRPLHSGTKHAHSTAYLVGAAAQTYMLTGAPDALQMATDAFAWLDDAARDKQRGGYFGWVTRDGQPILSIESQPALVGLREPLGTPIGLKDANVHSDLLQSFSELFDVWPDPAVGQRLAEVYRLITERFATGSGAMHFLLDPELSPVPAPIHYGYPLQSGARLRAAAQVIGADVNHATAMALRMLDYTLDHGWRDPEGGFMETDRAARRAWWVQAEGVKLLSFAVVATTNDSYYADRLTAMLAFIDRWLIDHEFGGWYPMPPQDRRRRARLLRTGLHKGDEWKDAAHEVDMYVYAIRLLRGLGSNMALELDSRND